MKLDGTLTVANPSGVKILRYPYASWPLPDSVNGLQNSDFENGTTKWVSVGVTGIASGMGYNGSTAMRMGKTDSSLSGTVYQYFQPKINHLYVISFLMRGDSTSQMTMECNTLENGKWIQRWYRYDVPSEYTEKRVTVYFDHPYTRARIMLNTKKGAVYLDNIVIKDAGAADVLGSGGLQELTVREEKNWVLPSVTVKTGTENAQEGLVPGTFVVSRSGGNSFVPLAVAYTVSGTASKGPGTANQDMEALPGFVMIPGGKADTTIKISARRDTLFESKETVVLTLEAREGYYALGTATSATVNILDMTKKGCMDTAYAVYLLQWKMSDLVRQKKFVLE
ncbi:MAG: hypothetical protein HQK83_10840 [Fibrobacteria bacterium]|nr:hypothetical protein [Fibrobacteria bacterium]